MPQSRVGSMQGSNKDCLAMRGQTRGGDAPTVLTIERTHKRGDVTQRTDTHFFLPHVTHTRTKPNIEVACCLKIEPSYKDGR